MAYSWESILNHIFGRNHPDWVKDVGDAGPRAVVVQSDRFRGFCKLLQDAADVQYAQFGDSSKTDRDPEEQAEKPDHNVDNDEIVVDQDSPQDPISDLQTLLVNNEFFSIFTRFVDLWITRTGRSFFLKRENNWRRMAKFMEGMMESQHLASRHTATLVYLTTVTVAARFMVEVDNAAPQEESELSSNEAKLNAFKRDSYQLQDIISHMSKKVSRRFRDRDPVIRRLCLVQAQHWCKDDMLHLVGRDFLPKALVYRLADEEDFVRFDALRVAVALFEDLEEKSVLVHPITEKLFGVICEQLYSCTQEKDDWNSFLAVKAISHAIKYFPHIMSEAMRQKLCSLIYLEQAAAGEQAGALLDVLLQSPEHTNVGNLRILVAFSSLNIGSESAIFCGLAGASSEWFFDHEAMMELLCDKRKKYSLTLPEKCTLIILFAFLVKWLATKELPPRERVHKADALQEYNRFLPVPKEDDVLSPVPTLIRNEFPYLLAKFVREFSNSCVYLLRLLQYMNYNESESEVDTAAKVMLSDWLEGAFRESDDQTIRTEIYRALAKLSRDDNNGVFRKATEAIVRLHNAQQTK